MRAEDLGIKTTAGHSLSSCLFIPEKSNGITVVISSATGVLQGFYGKFASYLSQQGYTVFTFDYWGIGRSGSEIQNLKRIESDLVSWGQNDQAAVISYAKEKNPNHELVLLTHSIGGQILCFNPKYALIDKVVMVASQSGYWRYFEGIHLPKMWIFWYAMIPILTPLFSYFPAKSLGLFENLPKNMAYQWMRWGKRNNYMKSDQSEITFFFDQFDIPILSLSFPKDEFAPRAAVDWLAQQFTKAKVQRVHHVPPKEDIGRLRHFGFFRTRFKSPLWDMVDQWIQDN